MKRTVGLVLFLVIVGVVFVSCAENVEKFKSGDFTYIVDGDGNATIINYGGNSKSVTIPMDLDGHPVKVIGDESFSVTRELESITIPDTVTNIGENPWRFCQSLTSIVVSPKHPTLAVIDGALYSKPDKRLIWVSMSTNGSFEIPRGIKIIGYGAFFCCENMTSVIIPDTVISIGNRAFYGCENLSTITIPGSITVIGDCAFESCISLTTVTIEEGVRCIGEYAFQKCKKLSTIMIPESLTTIGDYAFATCVSLNDFSLSENVSSLGDNPWIGCENLTKFSVSLWNPAFIVMDGVLYSKENPRLIWAPLSIKGSFEIPLGVQIIGNWAFDGCIFLTSIIIPETVNYIGFGAFNNCNNLSSIIIPESVTTIEALAFCYCWNLKSITIPDGISTIGKSTFAACYSLESVAIPDTVTVIDNKAFFNCKSLKSITIPDSVTNIGNYVFDDCPNLILTVNEGSYAEQYCIQNKLSYQYPNSLDWLND